jgi:nucleoside-diphosphate-sugar epimerase
MRILVIGGTRFIGRSLVQRLAAAGHEVVVFHRRRTNAGLPAATRSLLGDRHRLADHTHEFRRFGPEVVVDMIPFTEEDALSLLAVFRGLAGRLVVISSADVYRAYGIFLRLEQGPPEPTPITEASSLRQSLYLGRAMGAKPGDDTYDYEKILVERAVVGETGLPTTILRLPMVYGPGDAQHRLGAYLKQMLDKRPAILLNEGMARWRCLRGYVEDVAAAVALAATDPAATGRVYNVAEPTAQTEIEWVARIAAIVGWGGKIVALPDAKLPVSFNTAQDLWVDTTRIRAELGYREVVDREDALLKTVEWERHRLPDSAADYSQEDRLLADFGE